MSNEHASSSNKSTPGSGLLSELAGEATSKLRALQSEELDRQGRTQRLHAALHRVFQFFHTFSGHVNNIAPTIPRSYALDNSAAYTPLEWREAVADSRKQDLSDTALLDHVAFRVRLTAPGPVAVTRRWNQLDALKKELHISGLRSLDDLDMLVRNKSQQETFVASLAPEFILRLRFQGNYEQGQIDIQGSNVDGFGPLFAKLAPESITSEFLDDLGRFLIGRTSSLPLALSQGRYLPKQPLA